MKMLLGSSDLERLEPVAKRLVSSGIPIALCKPSQVSPCVEVWIQRDSDFSAAQGLLVARVVAPAVAEAPAERRGEGIPARSRGSRKRVSFVTSRIGFSIWWRRELREAEGTEGG